MTTAAQYAARWTPGAPSEPSILSDREDGCGFFYGRLPGDVRQINVRYERPEAGEPAVFGRWVSYADGIRVGEYETKAAAEAAAIEFLKERPQSGE